MALSRRDLLKISAILAATSSFGSESSKKDVDIKKSISSYRVQNAPLPKPKGPRVVVVGGGWSGLAVAKYLKKFSPKTDVVLIEKRSVFVSCPLSNLWLVDLIDLQFLTHDYLQAAQNNEYIYFNATVYDIDRVSKKVYTNEGIVSYDYLVLAPGIDYDYEEWTNGNMELETKLKSLYPAGFIPGSEHFTLKRKIEEFEEGNFVLTVPGGNYRCLPAPYERASLIAWYMKKEGIKGKVVLIDENPDITIKKDGFNSAFNELYKDYIEYLPGSKITDIDLDKKRVVTDMGDEIDFSDASFYPRIRGAKLLEIVGVAKDSAFNKKEADIDPFTYQSKADPYIYCTGDVRPMGFSKSGNTANSEGHLVAKIIASVIEGKEFKWDSPITVCYSAVSGDPIRAISVNAKYAYDKKKKVFTFKDASTMENWKGKQGIMSGKGLLEWAKGMYRDMFM
ncbi:NAD(P)/FAD-dependent oxidoreductase [Nitrosophilus labii]|uniref:NAD(P)/FAD-dependent oxidoreductase n=1 Tax=Nitrosophilus labii TaxID=2706014 RepID=UPI0016575B7F|nr:FAD/NAD(P)-binding oxidoreductase [Nitrosophilus labii]